MRENKGKEGAGEDGEGIEEESGRRMKGVREGRAEQKKGRK